MFTCIIQWRSDNAANNAAKAIKSAKQLWESREVWWGEEAAESWLQVLVDTESTPADLTLQGMLLRKLVFLYCSCTFVDFTLHNVYVTYPEFKVQYLQYSTVILLYSGNLRDCFVKDAATFKTI